MRYEGCDFAFYGVPEVEEIHYPLLVSIEESIGVQVFSGQANVCVRHIK